MTYSTKILIGVSVGFVATTASLIYYISASSMSGVIAPPVNGKVVFSEQVNRVIGKPKHITISTAKVDNDIENVGIAANGDMDVPTSKTAVAWYASGTRPGEIGSAVLSGHFGEWDDGSKSVFDELHLLQPGDKISITDDGGIEVSFVVREVKQYKNDADTSEIFNSSDGKAHVNLITCAGKWDKHKNTYTDRLVIFSEKEDVR